MSLSSLSVIELSNKLKKGDKCLVILPDSIRNYITKFVDDEWMLVNEFMDNVNDK